MTPAARGFAPVHSGQTLSEAFATILDHNFQSILAWEETARIGQDIEGVHQVRVSFRRSRSALKVFRPAVPRAVTDPWFVMMRALVSETGPARDLDVFIHEGLHQMEADLPPDGAKAMRAASWQKREQAYDQVRQMLDSDAYGMFRRHYPQWIEAAAWTDVKMKKRRRRLLAAPVIPGAQVLLDRQYQAVLAAGTGIDQSDAMAMHKLRITCKGLRYTAEFFLPLFAEMAEFVSHLKGLQDVLGVMHDGAVTATMVRHILHRRRKKELLAYGEAVIAWRLDQMEQVRRTFDPHWSEFIDARAPWRESGED